jgi:hypothetical protein
MIVTKEDFMREIHIRIIFGCLYCSIISSSALLMYIFDIGDTNFILVLISLLGLPVILIGLIIRNVIRNYAIITKGRLVLNFLFIVIGVIVLGLAIMYFQNMNNNYVFIAGTSIVFISSVVLGIIYLKEISKDWDFTDEEIETITG